MALGWGRVNDVTPSRPPESIKNDDVVTPLTGFEKLAVYTTRPPTSSDQGMATKDSTTIGAGNK